MAVAFTCPECEGTRLEEVMVGVTVTSTITFVGEGGDIEYGDESHDDGSVACYQCVDCGWAIPEVCDSEGLYKYLCKHLSRDQLLVEVGDFADRLVAIGDLETFKNLFGTDDLDFDIGSLSLEQLQDIFDENIADD